MNCKAEAVQGGVDSRTELHKVFGLQGSESALGHGRETETLRGHTNCKTAVLHGSSRQAGGGVGEG